VFIAQTRGIVDFRLTPESVRDQFDHIRAQDGYHVHESTIAEMRTTLKALAAAG
jgi:hypothetical protein